jgi:hypothetical protein
LTEDRARPRRSKCVACGADQAGGFYDPDNRLCDGCATARVDAACPPLDEARGLLRLKRYLLWPAERPTLHLWLLNPIAMTTQWSRARVGSVPDHDPSLTKSPWVFEYIAPEYRRPNEQTCCPQPLPKWHLVLPTSGGTLPIIP